MWSQAEAPKVSVKLRVHAGASFDQRDKEGTVCMLAEAFFPTNESRDFFAEELGGGLQIACNYDYVEIDATSKPESYLTMLETIASAVANPTLDRQTADAAESRLVTRLAGDEKNAATAADLAVRKRLFGTFPYGRPIFGSTASLKNIDFADLRFAYDRLFGADNATITISGNFPQDVAYRAMRRFFGSWLKSDRKVPSTFRQPDPFPVATQIVESPDPSISEIRYALRGVSRSDREFYAAQVLARILEERVRAKAPESHRENVWVSDSSNILPGVLIIGFSKIRREVTATVSGERPKVEANDIVANALIDKISEIEFSSAKASVVAYTNRIEMASRWLDVDTYKLTSEKADQNALDAVSLTDVQSYADRLKLQPVASVVLLSQKATK
jgi:predicted Zn-dependent peptidase